MLKRATTEDIADTEVGFLCVLLSSVVESLTVDGGELGPS
jgi:hypothetical protein